MAAIVRDYVYLYPFIRTLPVQAASNCEAGHAMSRDSSGNVGPLDVTDEQFAGFVIPGGDADNSLGSAGDIDVQIYSWGILHYESLTAVADSQVDDKIYMSSSSAFSTNPSGKLPIGYIIERRGTNTVYLAFKAQCWQDHT